MKMAESKTLEESGEDSFRMFTEKKIIELDKFIKKILKESEQIKTEGGWMEVSQEMHERYEGL